MRSRNQLFGVLLLKLYVVGHQPVRIVSELLGDLVACLADTGDLLVALFHQHRFRFLVHSAHLTVPKESPARAHTGQGDCSLGGYAHTCWHSPSAGSSMLPETRSCDRRPRPGEGHTDCPCKRCWFLQII